MVEPIFLKGDIVDFFGARGVVEDELINDTISVRFITSYDIFYNDGRRMKDNTKSLLTLIERPSKPTAEAKKYGAVILDKDQTVRLVTRDIELSPNEFSTKGLTVLIYFEYDVNENIRVTFVKK